MDIASPVICCRCLLEAIARTYGQAFGRAYPKDPRQGNWYGATLFLIGGGSLVDRVRERLSKRAWLQLEADPPIVDPGHPSDLHEEDGNPYTGDPRFLLVAYGLSHFAADVPETTNPSEIPVLKPLVLPERFVDHEDLYSER